MSKPYIKYSSNCKFISITKLMNNINGEVLSSYHKELNNIIDKIASDYNLSSNELKQKYLINDTETDKQVNEKDEPVYNEKKCHAITNKNKQCSRNKNENSNYCKSHAAKALKVNGLINGTIFNNNFKQNANKPICCSIIDSNNDNCDEIIVEKKIIDNEEVFIVPNSNKKFKKDNEDNIIELN